MGSRLQEDDKLEGSRARLPPCLLVQGPDRISRVSPGVAGQNPRVPYYMSPLTVCKGKDSPHSYTCLNTGYKLLTGTLTVIVQSHIVRVGLLPLEQKAFKKGARGCMDALAVDTTVTQEVKRGKKSLTVAWAGRHMTRSHISTSSG